MDKLLFLTLISGYPVIFPYIWRWPDIRHLKSAGYPVCGQIDDKSFPITIPIHILYIHSNLKVQTKLEEVVKAEPEQETLILQSACYPPD